MAYDEDLADRIRALVADQPVVERKMFGGLAFLIHGNMSLAAGGQGGLMLRIDPADHDAFLAEGAEPMQMGKRAPMKGWLRVEASALEDENSLRTWVDRGVDYALSLPPKR